MHGQGIDERISPSVEQLSAQRKYLPACQWTRNGCAATRWRNRLARQLCKTSDLHLSGARGFIPCFHSRVILPHAVDST